MSSICSDNHHSHHSLLTTKKLHHHHQDMNLNLPPRKLLTHRSNLIHIPISTFSHDFTDIELLSPDTHTLKFLPYNNPDEYSDEDSDQNPYSTDDFRIYEFKIRRCMRSRSHDWTDCPFAHPGEKARRRDPRKFHYSGNPCSDFRRGNCPNGDSCEFSHGVFECWLHPARYRTQVCKDGKNCKRKVCFFAHSPKQLRVLPKSSSPPPLYQSPTEKLSLSKNTHSSSLSKNVTTTTHHCNCVFCNSSSSSPTSTLMGFSHLSASPPLSPKFLTPTTNSSEISTRKQQSILGILSYKNKLKELVNSLEAIDINAISSPTNSINDQDFSWGSGNFSYSPSNYHEYPQQFFLSPDSTGQISNPLLNNDVLISHQDYGSSNYNNNNNGGISSSSSSSSYDPDLEWVNELIM